MTRLFLRRERILPGPLKVLQPAERRSPVPVKALALTSAALAAGLLLMPHLSPRLSVDPTPMVEFGSADAEPGVLAYAEPEPLLVVAPAEPIVVVAPSPVARAASEPVRPASPAPATQAAAAPAKASADTSLFQLDLLPVLEADGADLDAGAAPRQAAPKTASRRSAAGTRGTAVVASGGSAQH